MLCFDLLLKGCSVGIGDFLSCGDSVGGGEAASDCAPSIGWNGDFILICGE